MKKYFWPMVAAMMFGYGVGLSQVQQDYLDHVQFLEEYIQENQLPTPAWPIRDGEVVFEINVPICQ